LSGGGALVLLAEHAEARGGEDELVAPGAQALHPADDDGRTGQVTGSVQAGEHDAAGAVGQQREVRPSQRLEDPRVGKVLRLVHRPAHLRQRVELGVLADRDRHGGEQGGVLGIPVAVLLKAHRRAAAGGGHAVVRVLAVRAAALAQPFEVQDPADHPQAGEVHPRHAHRDLAHPEGDRHRGGLDSRADEATVGPGLHRAG